MWKPYKYFVLAMPIDNPGLKRILQRPTNYADTALNIKMRWDADQGIKSEVYRDNRYKAKLRLYRYLFRSLPDEDRDFYFSPFSDQRQELRKEWNKPKNKFITWDDFVINAEIKYRTKNNINLSEKL